jgi:hypothetical protein
MAISSKAKLRSAQVTGVRSNYLEESELLDFAFAADESIGGVLSAAWGESATNCTFNFLSKRPSGAIQGNLNCWTSRSRPMSRGVLAAAWGGYLKVLPIHPRTS